jgi:WD40 repeat protein
VLYLAGEHDGGRIVTGAGAGDESLRFWNLFEERKQTDRFDLR